MIDHEHTIRRLVVTSAVSRQIVCPHSGVVLDVDSAALLTNTATQAAAIVTEAVLEDLRTQLIASGGRYEVWHGVDGREEFIGAPE